MDWVKQLNIAIRYIEDHLTGTIEYDELAKMLCCSTYQFQRMFAFMNNVPLSEYIRRRKLSLAVADIQKGERVIDVALKYGYSSPTAFSRAFQCLHGITPSEARKKGTLLKTYPPISFKLTITGTEELTYRIEERSAFEVAGVSMLLDKSLEKNFCTVPQFWDNAVQDGTLAKLNSLDKGEVCDLLGISVCGDYETWKYYIAVATSETAKFEFEKLIIPASKWAIFSGKGTNVSLDYYEDFIFNWIAADHIYKKRASFVLIAASTIHDKSMTKETLDIYLKLVYENSCYEHDHIKKAVSWALREIGKTDFEYAEKVLLTAYDLLASGNKVQIWIAKDVIKELETVVKVKERKRLITSNSKMGRER